MIKIQAERTRKIILFAVLSLTITGVVLYWRNSYCEFKPLLFENDKFVSIEVDNQFYSNLQKVLKYNNIDFKVNTNGMIMVRRKICQDDELVWNFTLRTLDSTFLNMIDKSEKNS